MLAGGYEPKVAGAAFGVQKGKVSEPIEGMTGVYVIVSKGTSVNKQPGTLEEIMQSLGAQAGNGFIQGLLKSLEDNATIKDYRAEVL